MKPESPWFKLSKRPPGRRVYRSDRGSDLIKSEPKAVDRVEEFRFESTIAEFARVFGGRQRLVSIATDPWYLRQVWQRNPGEAQSHDDYSNFR